MRGRLEPHADCDAQAPGTHCTADPGLRRAVASGESLTPVAPGETLTLGAPREDLALGALRDATAPRQALAPAVELDRDVKAISQMGVVNSILQVVCQTTGMGFAAVARVTDDGWTACAVRDEIQFGLAPGGRLDVKTTLCREVRAAKTPIVIEHASNDVRYATHPTPKMYGLESYISVPIVLPGGEYFGNLCAVDRRPFPIGGPQVVEMFSLFANLIARQIGDERRYLEASAALAGERVTAELREQFIAVLGHDLRSPLGAISAIAELLELQGSRADAADLGRRLSASASRMGSLIDDVLDLARGRLGAGMLLTLQPEANLDVLLRNVITELEIGHTGRKVDATLVLSKPVVCDRTRIQQLLSNLVRNALIHGSERFPVRVSVQSDDQYYTMEVANGGPPIAPHDLARIFQPFARQSARSGSSQGLGLGLYICSQIAQAHGGSLEMHSTHQDGTRVTARLPLDGGSARPLASR